ncbi:MAG TPA: M56 family metallopeptidase, partial [Candidatus Acidoferrales bacterium]|nr:M56 family metallopeptidase [Candidatus Acidoferrales bacterium]
PVSIRMTDAAGGPALGGLRRPVIFIPEKFEENLTSAELRLVLLHELGHWRRCDMPAHLLVQGALVLHWFNPLVWVAARMARADCELACDEFVMRRLAPAAKPSYGATLLKVVDLVQRNRPTPAMLGIFASKQLLKKRIQMIADYRNWNSRRALAGWVFPALLAVAAVTGGLPSQAADSGTAITTTAPAGWWKNGSNPNAYVVGVDPTQPGIKPTSAYVKSIEPQIDGFGGMMQECSAENYRGKRLCFSAMMKTANAESAQLWFRVDGSERGEILEFDNMKNRPLKGDTDWTPCAIVLDVPMEATGLAYGFFIKGTGQAWVNNAKLEEVGTDVPTTGGPLMNSYPKAPVNMDFVPQQLLDTAFVLGPQKFREGDAISIQQVLATSPGFEMGDHVVVRGRYHLQSKEEAELCLFLTQTEGDGKERMSSVERMGMKKGSGEFELTYDVKHIGVLHLTFYGIPDGKPFGGVYFGTAQQMAKIKDWTLSDYEK